MMTEDTLQKLHAMKLFGFAKAFEEQQANPDCLSLSFEERFGLLVDHELTYRNNKRLKRLIAQAKFREPACLEDVNYRKERGLGRSQIATLSLCNWIEQGRNLIITGPTGAGKTWLARAFGNNACRHGHPALFHRLPLLLEELAIAHGDGSFRKRLNQLAKTGLLVLDDFLMGSISPAALSDLLEVVEQRAGLRSILVTSQYPVDNWHERLGGGKPTLADALLDRLICGAYRIDLKGGSMRRLRYED